MGGLFHGRCCWSVLLVRDQQHPTNNTHFSLLSLWPILPPSINQNIMKLRIFTALALIGTFCLGFSFHALITEFGPMKEAPKRVTGIGGIFFKCKDPKAV